MKRIMMAIMVVTVAMALRGQTLAFPTAEGFGTALGTDGRRT